MAFAFPLDLNDFFGTLTRTSVTFFLSEDVEYHETEGGEIITAERGPRLWTGEVIVSSNLHNEIRRAASRMELLQGAAASFMVTRSPGGGPVYDPTGSRLGNTSPTLSAINANRRDVTLAGLPSGYQLEAGDLLSFTYSTGPVRHALHRVVSPRRTATSAGSMANLELSPPVRAGASTGAAVRLFRPQCKAKVLPGSYTAPRAGLGASGGFTFRWRQTLR